MRRKVSVIGSGRVGEQIVEKIAQRGYADVVLHDIIDGLAEGKSIDLHEMAPISGFCSNVIGTSDLSKTADSDVILIVAGGTRTLGMTRADMMKYVSPIVVQIATDVVKFSPNCILINFSNPLDAMTNLIFEASGLPRNRVIGQAGICDSTRFKTWLAKRIDVAPRDVTAMVLGAHGDTMVIPNKSVTISGIPISEFLSQEEYKEVIDETIHTGDKIISLTQRGAYFAPSVAGLELVDSILLDQKRVLPCCIALDGEYGIEGVCLCVPTLVGSRGVEKIVEMELEDDEMVLFRKSEDSVRKMIDEARKYIASPVEAYQS